MTMHYNSWYTTNIIDNIHLPKHDLSILTRRQGGALHLRNSELLIQVSYSSYYQ